MSEEATDEGTVKYYCTYCRRHTTAEFRDNIQVLPQPPEGPRVKPRYQCGKCKAIYREQFIGRTASYPANISNVSEF